MNSSDTPPDRGLELDRAWDAARSRPRDLQTWYRLAEVLAGIRPTDLDEWEGLEEIVSVALRHPGVDPRLLSKTAAWILRLHLTSGPPRLSAQELTRLLDRPLSHAALPATVLPHLAVERALATVRTHLLLSDPGEDHRTLHLALAQQAFLTGYVWDYGRDEQRAVEALAMDWADRPLDLTPRCLHAVAAIGSYTPLGGWERAPELVELSREPGGEALQGIVKQQIIDPALEMEIGEGLETVAETSDAVSSRVRALYEAHPYPRWVRAGAPLEPRTVPRAMAAVFPHVPAGQWPDPDPPQILVAGCGTGFHLFQVLARFRDAAVTGLDLSRASLAYAGRKILEAGLEDRVELLQGDILGLEGWERRFDIVESVGVLHHLADPLEGWRILAGLLRPGGLMKVGLYSRSGRRGVTALREWIRSEGFSDDPKSILRARGILATGSPEMVGLDEDDFDWIRSRMDFFTLHEFRDLVFHPQEYEYDVGEIREAMATLGLGFLGFELGDARALQAFRDRNPDPAAWGELDAWEAFEREEPRVFQGMYQFWMRKPGDASPG